MVETVIGCLSVAGAAIGLLAALYRRSRGSRPFGKWQGGGKVPFAGAVALCIFMGCVGAGFLHHSAVWAIPAVCAWLVAYRSQTRANRRHQVEEEELRRRNALDHPGVFDDPPPSDLDATPGERVELYDAGACTYLGTVCKSDMKVIINTFAEASDQEANDIFIIDESLVLLSDSGVTQEFVTLLVNALKRRDYLLLRWMPE